MAGTRALPERLKPPAKNVDYHFRMSEKEYEDWTAAATMYGTGLRDWLRWAAHEKRERQMLAISAKEGK